MKNKIKYVDMTAQYEAEKTELNEVLHEALLRGDYVGGKAVDELEENLAHYIGVKNVVALNSGTDALVLGMKALGIEAGDEVITPPNSFVASTAAIVANGATPIFADVLDDQNIDPAEVEKKITPKTKAIMAVHLTGRVANMNKICEIARKNGLYVIEDSAQAVGSKYDDKMAGTFGHIGCFSTHPLKNLNAIGDGGFLTTDDDFVAQMVRLYRNHGLKDRNTVVTWGGVSRMDTIQAEILNLRLKKLDDIIAKRRENAKIYRAALKDLPIFIPKCKEPEFNSFHTFVVQTEKRDELQDFLKQRGVSTAIHYPIPIHLQPVAKDLGYKLGDFPIAEKQASKILTLPINQHLSQIEIISICELIREFFQ
jgi:dTDP-4-amino-4,6-dideoxygalactose transaminase